MRSVDEVRARLWDQYERLGTWRAVADRYGVHHTTIWKMATTDYEPKRNDIRRALGLSEIIQQRVQRDEQGRFS